MFGMIPEVAQELAFLSQDHREIEKMLNKGAQDRTLIGFRKIYDQVQENLQTHFRYEEEALFPILGQRIGIEGGPIPVMLGEHRRIAEVNEKMGQSTLAGNLSEAEDAFLNLDTLLRSHIQKEDRVLFPLASRVMGTREMEEFRKRMKRV